jgi:hypothetical protein
MLVSESLASSPEENPPLRGGGFGSKTFGIMARTKQTSCGRNSATSKPAKSAALETKLRRFVKGEETRGAYRDFPNPAEAVAELRNWAKRRH